MNILIYVKILGFHNRSYFKVASMKQIMEKTTFVLLIQKYGKFWSILLGDFTKHKAFISEERHHIGRVEKQRGQTIK